MSYHYSVTLSAGFDETIENVTEELQREGFGILTEIDVAATLKKKLDVDFRDYRILGACNPAFAYQALQSEDHIGVMLPCNVVVQRRDGDQVEVSAVDPVMSMSAVENPELGKIAEQVRSKLRQVIDNLVAARAAS
ncbi:MAG: DUF302 domain-containing protein [Candidatus Zixiibacteriota bacterium]